MLGSPAFTATEPWSFPEFLFMCLIKMFNFEYTKCIYSLVTACDLKTPNLVELFSLGWEVARKIMGR